MPRQQLRFGTSGLRGLVVDMTDHEVYVNTRGFLAMLAARGLEPGPLAIARDRRERCAATGLNSSPRIMAAVVQAARDTGWSPEDYGKIPTPALACYAMHRKIPCIMVTGSHIPADRNGVKFYKPEGEVLKSDEAEILAQVQAARALDLSARFDAEGMFITPPEPTTERDDAARHYVARYLEPFAGDRPLEGLGIVLYEHSSVARELLAEILSGLGVIVYPEGRTEDFVSVDTEDVFPEDEARYAELVSKHCAEGLVSTDGDGDRPLLVDERGDFHRGDALGILTAEYLSAEVCAVPVNSTDAIERHLKHADVRRTRIGSPYVIEAMNAAVAEGASEVVGWEANGGFLTAGPVPWGEEGSLTALPTRDAVLPLLSALLGAQEADRSLAGHFGRLPARYTRAGLLDNVDPKISGGIVAAFKGEGEELRFFAGQVLLRRPGAPEVELSGAEAKALEDKRALLSGFFGPDRGFGEIERMNFQDGVRAFFSTGEIVHLRASGNAPQLRIYAVADSAERADAIVMEGIREPGGTLRQMQAELL